MNSIVFENVCKSYGDAKIVKSLNLEIKEGERLILLGPSGCGKSTLARILLRLLPCDTGQILFNQQDITCSKTVQLKKFRQTVQFISQRPENFFDPLMKLGASLREPLSIFSLPCDEQQLSDVLETVKLTPALLDRYPHQVSGGEIQRLSIARALLLKPRLLILDEPTSMLDISVQAQILQLLQSIRQQEQMAFLFISHDKAVINYMCNRQLYMQEGRIT